MLLGGGGLAAPFAFDQGENLEEPAPVGTKQEEPRSRADAYFDILAHDVTNLISPIMVHAEFITLNKELPKETRMSAAKMVRQIRRTANFILSFRMLHEVASNPPTEPTVFDVRSFVKLMQKTASSEHPYKRPSISMAAHPKEPIKIVGAEYAQRIITGLVDNAIRNAHRADVKVDVSLSEVKCDDGRVMWRFEVTDDGPGIRDDLKAELVEPFETSKRLARKSPSSLMFFSAILGHLGGSLRIEDRVQGDMSKGTRAVVELPRDTLAANG